MSAIIYLMDSCQLAVGVTTWCTRVYFRSGVVAALFFIIVFMPNIYANAMSLTPATFNSSISPGCIVSYQIEVANDASSIVNESVYYKDVPSFARGSTVSERSKRGIGSWVSLNSSMIMIGPGQKESVEVGIKVPVETKSGNYFGMVAVSTTDPLAGEIAHIIDLTVSEEKASAAEALQITTFKLNDSSFFKGSGMVNVERKNVSELSVDLQKPAILEVKNPFGVTVLAVESNQLTDSILCPGQSVSDTFDWSVGLFSVGYYTFSLSEKDAQSNDMEKRVLIISPFMILSIVLFVFSTLLYIKRRSSLAQKF